MFSQIIVDAILAKDKCDLISLLYLVELVETLATLSHSFVLAC